MRILFVVKESGGAEGGSYAYAGKRSGLWNSVRMLSEAITEASEVMTKLVQVRDNNDIDRELAAFKPDQCVIEALWVVPEKFEVLQELHPNTEFYVHLHSHVPFLANEGIAIEWIRGYAKHGVGVIVNSPDAKEALSPLAHENCGWMKYLPNVYRGAFVFPVTHPRYCFLWVSCFGAVRPMKNQLIQAMAAIRYAQETERRLMFFMNTGRVETGGEPVLKNIRALFENSEHELVETEWMCQSDLLEHLRLCDISMQVSLSETFNIVSAQAVAMGTPIVVSREVPFASRFSVCDPEDISSIVKCMRRVEGRSLLAKWNQRLLRRYSDRALGNWVDWALS